MAMFVSPGEGRVILRRRESSALRRPLYYSPKNRKNVYKRKKKGSNGVYRKRELRSAEGGCQRRALKSNLGEENVERSKAIVS